MATSECASGWKKGLRNQLTTLVCLAGAAVWLFHVQWVVLSGPVTGLIVVLSLVFVKTDLEDARRFWIGPSLRKGLRLGKRRMRRGEVTNWRRSSGIEKC